MILALAAAAAAGLVAHFAAADTAVLRGIVRYGTQPAGQIFLRLLFMLVIPLVFSALVLGIAEMRDLRKLGRVGLATLAYTVCVSAIAVAIGLTLVNWLRPGGGMSEAARARLLDGAAERAAGLTASGPPRGGIDLLLQIIPDNPVRAAANGDMLAVLFFAMMIGIGAALARTEATEAFLRFLQGLFDVTMRLIKMVISVAPIGVFALVFTLTAQIGHEVLLQLARYVGVVLLGLLLHQVVVYSLAVGLVGRMRPLVFFRGIGEAMITAFSTASSNATLPTALRVAEEKLKLPHEVSRFVLTIGATANQNGTALFEGVTVLFLAQFYGIDLSFAEQAMVVGICILGGIGTAGVPAGSLPVIVMILGLVGIPVEGIGMILGVDRLLDMCRTVLNVSGDLAAAVVVSRATGAEATAAG
jgi:DAACS family dicarboxylate/amino acid:cation (Na+ or H+) symporter